MKNPGLCIVDRNNEDAAAVFDRLGEDVFTVAVGDVDSDEVYVEFNKRQAEMILTWLQKELPCRRYLAPFAFIKRLWKRG